MNYFYRVIGLIVIGMITQGVGLATPRITEVGIKAKTIDLDRKETLTVSFRIQPAAKIALVIHDLKGRYYQSVIETVSEGRGTISWDGRDQEERLVGPGVYLYTLQWMAHENQSSLIFDPSYATGGKRIEPLKASYEENHRWLKYFLPKPAMVRIRFLLTHAGPHLGTLVEWSPREAGSQQEDLAVYKNYPWGEDSEFLINGYSLPENSVIVKSSALPREQELKQPGFFAKPSYFTIPDPDRFLHARNDQDPREIKLHVDWVGRVPPQQGGVFRITNESVLRITVPKEQIQQLIQNRSELMVFMGTTMLFEEEDAIFPLTIKIPTQGIGKGQHILGINIMDYSDHWGTWWVPIIKQ